jgi:hypothetical protein
MTERRTVQLQLHVTGVAGAVGVRITQLGERWTASVECAAATFQGIGSTAREALTAALAPLGGRTAAQVMAAPAMFGASAQLLEPVVAG